MRIRGGGGWTIGGRELGEVALEAAMGVTRGSLRIEIVGEQRGAVRIVCRSVRGREKLLGRLRDRELCGRVVIGSGGMEVGIHIVLAGVHVHGRDPGHRDAIGIGIKMIEDGREVRRGIWIATRVTSGGESTLDSVSQSI